MIPFDKLAPTIASGIRIGTPAVTTQGMGVEEMHKIGELISSALANRENNTILNEIGKKVKNLAGDYPVYSEG